MKEFKDLLKDVDKGMLGKNLGIPTGFKELDKNTNGIQKSIYTLLGGNSGTGKTSYVDLAYVLNPYEYLLNTETDYKLKIIYNSMERNTKYKLAKWTCLKLFKDKGLIIDVPTLFQWQGAKYSLNAELRELIAKCEEYFEKMSDTVTIYSGADNPTGIYHKAVNLAKEHGKVEKLSQYENKYFPYNDNLITLIINDHVGKCKPEVNDGIRLTEKALLDKHTEYMGILRDFYSMSIVDISQFNRSISNIERFKNKTVSPEPDDFKGSGDMYENADLVLALFNPYKLKIEDFLGYEINKFIAPNGENRFRSVSVLKNSYGADDIIIGMNFLGENGFFRELPNADYFKQHPDKYTKAAKFEN